MAAIGSYYTPPKLYRYRPLRSRNGEDIVDREIGAVEQGYLHCSGFEDLNDPMEGTFSIPPDRWQDTFLSQRWAEEAFEMIRAGKLLTRICSFSEAHDHDVMWAHYADHFSGICVEYDLPKLLKRLPDNIEFVRLFYSDKEPEVRNPKPRPSADAKTVLSFKTQKWLYEREWRMFAPREFESYQSIDCVTAVYFGSRCRGEQFETASQRLQDIGVQTKKMKVAKYSIEFQDL